MDERITLTANSKEELNKLIDSKLKEGYLLKGGMYAGEQGEFIQIMTQAHNIDGEFTLASAIKIAIMLPIMALILYFAL